MQHYEKEYYGRGRRRLVVVVRTPFASTPDGKSVLSMCPYGEAFFKTFNISQTLTSKLGSITGPRV